LSVPTPSVSVVIPTHNRGLLLIRAIRSVLEQTYENLECIVVDDASTDDTQGILATIDDPRLIVLRHKHNLNASCARNTGFDHARGDYVALLDDDDEWLPTKVERQMALLRGNPSLGMVYCWMDYVNSRGQLRRHYRPRLRGHILTKVLDRQRIGNSSTLMLRADVVREVRGFDESLIRGDDGDFIRRVARLYPVDFVPAILVRVYIGHGDRLSRDTDKSLRQQLQAARTKLDKFGPELAAHPWALANVHRELGNTHAYLNEWREARCHLAQAWRVDPLNPRVYRDLARLVALRLRTAR